MDMVGWGISSNHILHICCWESPPLASKDFLLPVLLLAYEQAELTVLDLGSAKKNTQGPEQVDKTIGPVLPA